MATVHGFQGGIDDREEIHGCRGSGRVEDYQTFRRRYKECIRMLNGLEKTLERKLPERDRRWPVAEESALYTSKDELCPSGLPIPAET